MSDKQMQPAKEVEELTDIFADVAPPAALTAPEPIKQFTPDDIKARSSADKQEMPAGIVKVKSEVKERLKSQADQFAEEIFGLDDNPQSIREMKDKINAMGAKEIREMSRNSNSFLAKPVRAMKEMQEGKGVANTLMDLRRVVEDLDPGRREKIWDKSKWLNKIPFIGNKVDNYFKEFQAAETQIDAILEGLYSGKDSLQKDNATIEVEKEDMWKTMGMMEQYIYVTKKLSDRVEEMLPSITDPYKAKVVKEDILFTLKQRHMDLCTNMAVNVQSYLSLDVVAKNNEELIKGVDRASTTTVQALRVAVMVSQALATQELVLNQLKKVNTTTENLILSNAKRLNQQGLEIQKQAISSGIRPEVLNEAFTQVVAALNSMDTYKGQAIESMDKTITTLTGTIDNMKQYMDKNREKAVEGVSEALTQPAQEEGVIDITRKSLKI